MRPLALTLLASLAVTAAADAQERHRRNFRFDYAGSFGRLRHETDSSNFDGRTDGGLARIRFEGVSRHGIGGGLRLETWGSDDDLFVDEGFAAQEARARAFFGHFTYRLDRGKFLMPVRIGVLLHNYELEDVASGGSTIEVDSIGTRFELAPEVIFNRGSRVEFSGYGEFGFAGGFSEIEASGSTSDFDSASGFWFAEIGARVRWKFLEFGTGFVHHGMAMAESDTVGGSSILGFGSGFTGVIFTGAFVF